MIDPADLVAALRKALDGADLPPEVARMLDELGPRLGREDPERFRAALAEALPELRALRAGVGEASRRDAAVVPPPDPDRAVALLRELSAAWTSRDGSEVDRVLGQLNESRVQVSDADRERIRAEVRGAIAARMANFKLQ